MKVITLRQPWATLVSEGLKEYEFRTWKINYRGEILIHAGATVDKEAMAKFETLNLKYPKKKILAKVEISDCLELNAKLCKAINNENPLIYGNKIRTGYAWKLSNIRKIDFKGEISGKLGIWNYNL